MIRSFTPFGTIVTTAAVAVGLSRRLTQAVGLIQFDSPGGAGRRCGNGTVSIEAVSTTNFSSKPALGSLASTSKTRAACAISKGSGFGPGWDLVRSVVEAVAMIFASGAMSWTTSVVSPGVASATARRRSPIASGRKRHSIGPEEYPSDRVLPGGNPLMTMTLRSGTPSVPSSAMGKLTLSPCCASRTLGAVSTGEKAGGAAGWAGKALCSGGGAAGVAATRAVSFGEGEADSDQGGSMIPSQKRA